MISVSADAPKTSEYAFFKKLKEDIGGYYVNDRKTETSIPSNISKSERERPTNQFSLLSSPTQAKPDNVSELNSRDEYKENKQRSSLPCVNHVTPQRKNFAAVSPFSSVSNNSGNPYAGTGIFSVKRQKIRQLVANTFPAVGDCSAKGFDLVSLLISRLFPNGNEDECCRYSISKGVLDTTYQLPVLPGSDAEEKIHTRNTTKFKYASCWNNDFPEYWSSTPRKRVLSKRDVTISNVPLIEYNAETDFRDKEAILNCGLHDKAITNIFRDRDSSYYLSFNSQKSLSSDHLRELDGFLNEPVGKEPQILLLGWDVNEEKEQTFCSTLATSSDVAYRKILDDSLDLCTNDTLDFYSLATSSDVAYWKILDDSLDLCTNDTRDFYSLPSAYSTSARWHDLRRDHEDNYAVANQFPFFYPKYLTMAEDCDTCCLLEKNNVNLHNQDYTGRKGHFEALLFSGGVNDDKRLPLSSFSGGDCSSNSHIFHFPFREDICPFAPEESWLYRPKHRETTVTFSEGAFDVANWFAGNLHAPLDKLMGHSLLLDNSGRFRSEEEIPFDDDDDNNHWNVS
ncbi:hypothetical protein ACH5RR_020352 [Cinchona calisaya]|uniref:Uncharacterized protein n=1 Tax=Cinchona calisaya TaxID=153742 RepID=A0ABD2ZFB8_9GENT